MRAHALLMICVTVGIAACGSERGGAGDSGAARARREVAVKEVARRTTEAVQNRSITLSCNASHAPPSLSHALIVTARQCYTCDAVGYAIRRITQQSSGNLLILTPAADASDVCRYLREERIRAPVALLPANTLPGEVSDELTYFKLLPEGGIRVVEGTNGSLLLRRLAMNNPTQRRIP